MSSGTYVQADVRCPFYLKDSNRPNVNIKCEGITNKSKVFLNFGRKTDKMVHMKQFCTSHYENCALYKSIYEQYEDE